MINRYSPPLSGPHFKGTSFNRTAKAYNTHIRAAGKSFLLGWFKDAEEAAHNYDWAAKQLIGLRGGFDPNLPDSIPDQPSTEKVAAAVDAAFQHAQTEAGRHALVKDLRLRLVNLIRATKYTPNLSVEEGKRWDGLSRAYSLITAAQPGWLEAVLPILEDPVCWNRN